MPHSHIYHLEKPTDVHSKHLGRDVIVEIFLPFQYGKENKDYPLLLLNDGQDSEAIQLKVSLEKLTHAREIEDIIVVGIYAGDRSEEYGVAGKIDYKERGGQAKNYSKFILTELIPYLHHRYSVSPHQQEHAIAGFSLGGLSAFDIAWHQADYFGKVGAFSGSFWWRRRNAKSRFYSDYRDRIILQQVRRGRFKAGMRFWFQAGLKDEDHDRNKNGVIDSVDDTLDLIVELTKKGYRPFEDIQYYEMKDGEHNLKTWALAMPHFLRWAFPL